MIYKCFPNEELMLDPEEIDSLMKFPG